MVGGYGRAQVVRTDVQQLAERVARTHGFGRGERVRSLQSHRLQQ